jgi:hypothetical protein
LAKNADGIMGARRTDIRTPAADPSDAGTAVATIQIPWSYETAEANHACAGGFGVGGLVTGASHSGEMPGTKPLDAVAVRARAAALDPKLKSCNLRAAIYASVGGVCLESDDGRSFSCKLAV